MLAVAVDHHGIEAGLGHALQQLGDVGAIDVCAENGLGSAVPKSGRSILVSVALVAAISLASHQAPRRSPGKRRLKAG
ncbi:MAG: hypothetical protein U1F47_03190 [Hyphomicrobiales bacterium]